MDDLSRALDCEAGPLLHSRPVEVLFLVLFPRRLISLVRGTQLRSGRVRLQGN